MLSRSDVVCGWADALLARVGPRLVVWTGARGDLVARGLEVVEQFGVVAAVLSPAGADARHVGVALEFGCRLVDGYDTDRGGPGGCLTSWAAPEVPAGMVRVPHLVSVCGDDGRIGDSVVWQVTSPPELHRWVGRRVDLIDLRFVEANVHALARLRGAVREGRLPATAAAARLLRLLPDGDGLSIRLVYQRSGLFRALLASVSTLAAPVVTGRGDR
jgi:hypothetical protein